MQIKSPERDFSSNVQSGNQFTVKASSKAFDILSSGIYSDKEKAIVRELVCNAYDSHVDAGKLDTPFHVHVPSDIVPVFYVEDFGLGLKTEDVMELYTSYFTSTKTESNDVVGALGLGSKSPFAYTDTFTVESTYDGVRTQFVAYRGADGLPMISEMGSNKVDAPNGLKVSVGINSSDFRIFKMKTKEIMSVFNPDHYKILNDPDEQASPELVDPMYVHENLNFYEGNGSVSAIMGNIRYPIDMDIIRDVDINLVVGIQSFIGYSLNVHIHFEIGDLDISASREGLGYDQRTVNNIITQLKKVTPFLRSLVIEAVENSDCWYNASLNAIKVIRTFNGNCNIKFHEMKYNNVPIQDKITLDKSWHWATFYKIKTTRGGNIARGDVASSIAIDEDTIIFCNDINRGVYPILSHNYNARDIKYKNCYIVSFNHYNYLFDAGVEERFEQIVLGGKKMVKVSELEPVPKVKRQTYKKTIYTEMMPIDVRDTLHSIEFNKRRTFSIIHDYQTSDHDLDTGGVYILTSSGQPETDRFYFLLRQANILGLMKDIPFYSCPKSVYRQIKKMPQWVDFYEYIEKSIDDVFPKKNILFFKRHYSAEVTLQSLDCENERFKLLKEIISERDIQTKDMDNVSEYFFNKLRLLIGRSKVYNENINTLTAVHGIYIHIGRKWPLQDVSSSEKTKERLSIALKSVYNTNPVLKFIDEDISEIDYDEFIRSIQILLSKK